MKNRLILFSNTKGGSGKSTLLGAFANYLLLKGEPVVVVDIDSQAFLYGNRQEEIDEWKMSHPEEDLPDPPYPIFFYRELGENIEAIIARLKQIEGWILVDCPGNQTEDRLIPWWQAADHLVVPVNYDRGTRRTTKIYAETVRQITDAPMTFVPNRIRFEHGQNKVQDQDEKATKELLRPLGNFTPRVKEGVAIARFSTISMLDPYQLKAVMYAFDELVKFIK